MYRSPGIKQVCYRRDCIIYFKVKHDFLYLEFSVLKSKMVNYALSKYGEKKNYRMDIFHILTIYLTAEEHHCLKRFERERE